MSLMPFCALGLVPSAARFGADLSAEHLLILSKFHWNSPKTTTWQEVKPPTLAGAPRRARGKISSSRARSRATRS